MPTWAFIQSADRYRIRLVHFRIALSVFGLRGRWRRGQRCIHNGPLTRHQTHRDERTIDAVEIFLFRALVLSRC
jgi:hypothetical protein